MRVLILASRRKILAKRAALVNAMSFVKIASGFNAVRDHAPIRQGTAPRLFQIMGPTRAADFVLTHLGGSLVGSVIALNFDVSAEFEELRLFMSSVYVSPDSECDVDASSTGGQSRQLKNTTQCSMRDSHPSCVHSRLRTAVTRNKGSMLELSRLQHKRDQCLAFQFWDF